MNKEEAVELLPIIKAFSEERPIQYRIKDNKTAIWNDVDKNYHEFSPHSFQYRIKPEEVEDIGLCPNDEGTSCAFTEIGINDIEFKDGDIVTVVFPDGDEIVCIFKEKSGPNYFGYFGFFSKGKYKGEMCLNSENDCFYNGTFIKGIKFATEEEKKQLFDVLENEGKAWDAEKKEVVELKHGVELKPFDKIIAFDKIDKEWVCDIFSHYSKDYEGEEIIVCIGGREYYSKALPFNKETEKLLGTAKDMEG